QTQRTLTCTLLPYTTLFRSEAYKPSKKDELANIFVEEENDREEFFSILDELAENGDIFINKRGKVGTLEDYEMKRGKFRSTKRRSEEHTSELQSRFDLVCRL